MIDPQTLETLEFCAIDFESAGTATGKTDAPIQVGMVSWSLEKGIIEQWSSYIYTDQDITWAAQKVHGIKTSDLIDAPKMALLWPRFKAMLGGRTLVAHGHGTEKRYLGAFPGHNFGPWVDTLQLARATLPDLENHSLGTVCKELQLVGKINEVVPQKTWHDALYDAVASILVLECIVSITPE